jgi:hypothetical protein
MVDIQDLFSRLLDAIVDSTDAKKESEALRELADECAGDTSPEVSECAQKLRVAADRLDAVADRFYCVAETYSSIITEYVIYVRRAAQPPAVIRPCGF